MNTLAESIDQASARMAEHAIAFRAICPAAELVIYADMLAEESAAVMADTGLPSADSMDIAAERITNWFKFADSPLNSSPMNTYGGFAEFIALRRRPFSWAVLMGLAAKEARIGEQLVELELDRELRRLSKVGDPCRVH